MTIPVITAEKVTRRFGDTTALDHVSFTLERPEIIGLLGRNGAGKTTLMSLITGQDRPTAGSVLVHGENPFESAHTQDELSFIRDNQRYPDDYRLRHVLRIAPWFHANWSADLAEHLLEVFRLPEKTKVKSFSRGQLSALGVVVGLASRAPLTFLDEPYLGLDATARQLFYDTLITDHAEHPRTVIASTHLIDEMAPLFSRVLVLDRGKLVIDRDADDLHGYAHTVSGIAARVAPFVAGADVLTTHRVGALTSITVRGPIDPATASRAAHEGVDIQAATLQQVVNAIGSAQQPSETIKEAS